MEGWLSLDKKEGSWKNLQLVEDQNLNSYRVRCSKHDLISHFKFDNEWKKKGKSYKSDIGAKDLTVFL